METESTIISVTWRTLQSTFRGNCSGFALLLRNGTRDEEDRKRIVDRHRILVEGEMNHGTPYAILKASLTQALASDLRTLSDLA